MAKHNAPPPPPPPEMVVIVADEPINHDGDDYAPGEPLECTLDQAVALVSAGAAHDPNAAPADAPQA